MTSADRFGHWTVAGKKYSNKLTAVIDAVKLGHWIHWDFNESVFQKYDWTVEPNQSLQSLYDQRARQIREKYEFVALEFSGGADSWNMLYAFCRQRLTVDLVIHKTVDRATKGKEDASSENQWAEGKYQAWPAFVKLKELNPNMKWVTWELEKGIVDGWKSPVDLMTYNNLHPGIVMKVPDKNNVNPFGIPQRGGTAYLYGTDKPIVELRDNGWYFTFYDYCIINRGVVERSMLDIGWDDILFYWDPDCVPLMIKQAHTIKNFFQTNPAFLDILKTADQRSLNYTNLIIKLIYPDYKAEWYHQPPKGTFCYTSDDFFINRLQNSSTELWHDTLNQYSNLLSDITKNTPFSEYIHSDKGAAQYNVLATCPSHHYYLGPP